MRKFTTFVLLLILILAAFPLYSRFKVAAAPVAPGVHLGGLSLSAVKDPAEIEAHLVQIYRQPIAVFYAGERLVLDPAEVGFQVDVQQMIGEARQYLEGPDFLDIAVRQALGLEQQRRDVPVRYLLDSAKLRIWLEGVAAEHDGPPQGARLFPPSDRWQSDALAPPDAASIPPGYVGAVTRDWTWTKGAPGYTLDLEASIPLVIAALARDTDRVVELALRETPPPDPSMDDLAQALDSYFSDFPGFAAVYVHDLVQDKEAHVDTEVAFSGMSTLKIGIVAAAMRKLENGIQADDPVSYEVGQWMDFALGESNNYAANLLLRWLGNGDTGAGGRYFTDFMRGLGFTSTYMQSGYDFEAQLPQIPTPGNQQEEWDTNPDTNLQSTPADMGRLLTAIYECSLGRGLIIENYGDEITPAECETVLFYLGHDEFQELLWSGLPEPNSAWIIHKHGFAYESHSDVALIWGPTGPYVLSVFLFRRGWMDWETSNGAMKDVSRIVWNFFEFQRQATGVMPPPAPELSSPAGYVPLGGFVPAAQ